MQNLQDITKDKENKPFDPVITSDLKTTSPFKIEPEKSRDVYMRRSIYAEGCGRILDSSTRKTKRKALLSAITEVSKRIKDPNPPSPKTVRRWLKKFNNSERMASGNSRTKSYAVRRLPKSNPYWPFEYLKISRYRLDITIAEDDQNEALPDHAYLDLGIYHPTLVIAGFHISHGFPNDRSVVYCLNRCMINSEHLASKYPHLKRLGIYNVVLENSIELRSLHVEKFCQQHGVCLLYDLPSRPEYGYTSDRIIGKLNQFLIQAGTFSEGRNETMADADKMPKPSIKAADIDGLIHKWISDFNHKRVQKQLNRFSLKPLDATNGDRKALSLFLKDPSGKKSAKNHVWSPAGRGIRIQTRSLNPAKRHSLYRGYPNTELPIDLDSENLFRKHLKKDKGSDPPEAKFVEEAEASALTYEVQLEILKSIRASIRQLNEDIHKKRNVQSCSEGEKPAHAE